MKIVVLSTDTEQYMLNWWLPHTAKKFDFGVIVDFNWEEIDGIRLRVFTKEYLLMIRPRCCESGCRNCPWEYKKTKKTSK